MSLLDGISFFDDLTSGEKDNLALFCQERLLKSGDVLFHEGDEAVALYIVKSGQLKVYKNRSDGEKALGLINPGEFVGEMAFFDGDNTPKRRMASVRATENTDLIVIMNHSLVSLAKARADIYEKISNIIRERKLKNANN